jgi:hypothetical protein
LQAAAAVMVAAVLFKQRIELYIFGFVYSQESDIVPVNQSPEPQHGPQPASYP